LLEAETKAVAGTREGLHRSGLAAGLSEYISQLQERPVLVQGRDIALACRERILNIPIKGQSAPKFAEHERAKDLAVPVLFLEDLIRARECREFPDLAKERLSEVTVELPPHLRHHIPSTSNGTGYGFDCTEVVGESLSNGSPAQ
jgi:hypothetical protein